MLTSFKKTKNNTKVLFATKMASFLIVGTTLSSIFVDGWCVWTDSPQMNLSGRS